MAWTSLAWTRSRAAPPTRRTHGLEEVLVPGAPVVLIVIDGRRLSRHCRGPTCSGDTSVPRYSHMTAAVITTTVSSMVNRCHSGVIPPVMSTAMTSKVFVLVCTLVACIHCLNILLLYTFCFCSLDQQNQKVFSLHVTEIKVIFYRATHVAFVSRPSVCLSVCNVDVPWAYRFD